MILQRFLADRRRSFAWWSAGIAVYVLFNNAFFPSVRRIRGIGDVMRNLPAGLRAILGTNGGILLTSPAGYQQARLFGLVLPLIFLVFSVSVGTAAVAGSEEDGTLELLAASPVTRTRLVLERFAGQAVLVLGLGATTTAAVLVFSPPFGLLDGVSVGGLAAACGGATLLAVLHGSVAAAVGAVTGRRGPAIGAATGVALAGNLLNALSAMSDALHPARLVTPWHWYLGRNMMVQGVAAEAFLLPLAISALMAAVAWRGFVRRDLRIP